MSKGSGHNSETNGRNGRWAEENTRDHSKFPSSNGWVDAAAINHGEKNRFGGE